MSAILQTAFTEDQLEIIKAVLYFDVFNYPLTRRELFENSAVQLSWEDFQTHLDHLLKCQALKQEGDYIQNPEGTSNDISRRLYGNAGAEKIMPLAYDYSQRISAFPFVEGVCLSGALSKNYYDDKGDIDFFIITKPGRLWICRTLLILRFKLLPKNKKKYWCTNYFISSDDLYIPDNNAFTGTELAYLIPTVNYASYQRLLEENNWYKNRFPNKNRSDGSVCLRTASTVTKRLTEFFLKGKAGQWADNLLLYLTLKHWQKKYPELSKEDFDLQFRSRKNVCKRHTHGFQNRVLRTWQEKQKRFEKTHNVVFG